MKVAIIGGGPIGLFTGISLGDQGDIVDLYELGYWPKDRLDSQGSINDLLASARDLSHL